MSKNVDLDMQSDLNHHSIFGVFFDSILLEIQQGEKQ